MGDRRRLPEFLEGPNGLTLRRWVRTDAELLECAVAQSVAHLQPWMAWVQQEPLPLTRRRAMLESWDREWVNGGDVVMGVFVRDRVAGGCGLHRRIGPGGLEIGYWTHPAFLRRGIATTAASMLTSAAFALPEITHVEIHHDEANQASAGIPKKLGYRLLDRAPDEPEAPAELGIEWRWRVTREAWHDRASPR